NRFVAQEATVATFLGPDVRGTLQAGWRRATGPVPGDTVRRSGTSYGAGGYVIAALGHGAVVRAGLGVRRVEPEASPAHTPLCAARGRAATGALCRRERRLQPHAVRRDGRADAARLGRRRGRPRPRRVARSGLVDLSGGRRRLARGQQRPLLRGGCRAGSGCPRDSGRPMCAYLRG